MNTIENNVPITSSASLDDISRQPYRASEKLNFFEKLIFFIRDIFKLDVLDNHLNDVAQRLNDLDQCPGHDYEFSKLFDLVLELKGLTKSELQKNYEIVQLSSLKKNEDTGEFYIANDKIIFMYDETKIVEYVNATFLNENNNIPDIQDLLINSGMPITNGYISCQYKEMENCFNDIAMGLRRIKEENNPDKEGDLLNLKTSLEKLDTLSQINDFMRAHDVVSKVDGGDTYRIKLDSIKTNLNNLSNGLKGSNISDLLNELTNSIHSLKDKIASDKCVGKSILNKKNEINRIKHSEEGGKNSKIETIKQTIDNIESLIQYCENALNLRDITKLA